MENTIATAGIVKDGFAYACIHICVTLTGFWKTDHFVTFDIIYISVYLRHSRWY